MIQRDKDFASVFINDDEAPVLVSEGVWHTHLLPLLPDPLLPSGVSPFRVPSMSQIDLFKNYMYK